MRDAAKRRFPRATWAATVVAVLALGTQRLAAQGILGPGNEVDDYIHLLQLTGHARMPLIYRSPSTMRDFGAAVAESLPSWAWGNPLASGADHEAGHASLRLLDPELHTVYNSAFPRGVNDGALWAGRGLSGEVRMGALIKVGPFTGTLAPTLWFTQNRDFPLAPVIDTTRSIYAYPWNPKRIDWPQRFGPSSFSKADWGQSGLRFDRGPFTVGVSTENLWWGPAFRNAIMMSNTAPGFPHLDLGIARPVSIGFAQLETRLVWGRLAESAYFDTISTNNTRLFTGYTLAIGPRGPSGLTVGIARVLYKEWSDSIRFVDFVDVFQPFFKNQIATSTDPEGNDDRDQLLSVFGRWQFPEVGFEVYGEWARNDHSRNPRDFILEPDHSRGYTIGFAKAITRGDAEWRLRAEETTLGRSATFQVRIVPTFYVHHLVVQGYTNQGQLLGAGIGPGSNGQILTVDRYNAQGRIGLSLERVRWNDDAYYALFPDRRKEGHDVDLAYGLSALHRTRRVDVGLALTYTHDYSRYYTPGVDASNLNAQATITWHL